MIDSDSKSWVFPPPATPGVPVRGSPLLFPVHRLYCVGQNYREHAAEMGAPERQPPVFFAKPADAVCTAATLAWPGMTDKLHHEVELVVALAAGGRNVPAANALSLVFGYAVGVDLTRRDLQEAAKRSGSPWTTGKGFDCSAPISAIARVADGGHPDDAAISLSVNGEIRQQGRTGHMTWRVPEVIAELSRYFELRPGDLIFTGTPAGVGPLRPGDRVDCRVDGVASLSFRLETGDSE
ncbi:MAG: fumarylacetoacetate hydrolase family protein [Xanthomonadales bacterium]|nr:fumarylacetoacetate hydrolase family protein [Xanthomonadales bacterium]